MNYFRKALEVGASPRTVHVVQDQLKQETQESIKQAYVKLLDEHVETASGHVSIGTMHLAKGLEFRAVAVMACDDEVVPLQARMESVGEMLIVEDMEVQWR